MNLQLQKRLWFVAWVAFVVVIAGCFFPLVVTQPSSAEVDEVITVTLGVTIDETVGGAGGGPAGGICAVLLDTNWTIESVSYDGDYGPDGMSFLHPDSSDKNPGAGVDFWYYSVSDYFPPPDGKDWIIFEQDEDNYLYLGDTTNNAAELEAVYNVVCLIKNKENVDLELYLDSAGVSDRIQGKHKRLKKYITLSGLITVALSKFATVKVVQISREKNTVADGLVQLTKATEANIDTTEVI